MHSALETADLWEGALLLAAGARLVGVRVTGNGHKTGFFLLEGEDLVDLARTYRDGSAVARVADLRKNINLLRDALFRELREPQEKESRPCPLPRGSNGRSERTRS